jgi:hypothetical protein
MSLSSFLAIRDVWDKVKPLRAKLPRKIASRLQVKPRSDRYSMVGTAFDYLLCFELQRRAPHAVAERWVAEQALDSKRARAVLDHARVALSTHLQSKDPTRAQLAELAAHAIHLAKLEVIYREGRFDPLFEQAESEDIDDLLSMLDIVPFKSLLHSEVVLLNPNFKESSQLVGGADTDLIAGDLMVDFKVSAKDEMSVRDLDQLLGYYLLARNQRRLDSTFPEINRVALYFCRHGYLWVVDTTTWTEHPDFTAIEKWFYERAREDERRRTEDA